MASEGGAKKAALVTGAGGFVGRHMAERLVACGYSVTVSDLRDPQIAGTRFVQADITSRQACEQIVSGVESVFHVASMVQTKQSGAAPVWAVNHGGTCNLLAAAQQAGTKRFIYVSSASVVYQGQDIENGDENLPYTAVSQAPYADSKIAAERDVLAANGKAGMLTCSLRPHVIFGPGDGRFLPAILRRAKAGALRLGVGRENKLSDFTYIDNLIDALMLAEEKLAAEGGAALGGKVWFVTNGEPMPFWDFVDQVLVESGLPRIRARIPYRIAYAAATVAESVSSLLGTGGGPENGFTRFAIRYLCTHHYFSIDRARRDLGYNPTVSIAEGIRRTVESLRRSGELAA